MCFWLCCLFNGFSYWSNQARKMSITVVALRSLRQARLLCGHRKKYLVGTFKAAAWPSSRHAKSSSRYHLPYVLLEILDVDPSSFADVGPRHMQAWTTAGETNCVMLLSNRNGSLSVSTAVRWNAGLAKQNIHAASDDTTMYPFVKWCNTRSKEAKPEKLVPMQF